MRSNKKEIKIFEIPICFEKRDKGDSKRNLMKFIMTYLKTIRVLLRMRKIEKNRVSLCLLQYIKHIN